MIAASLTQWSQLVILRDQFHCREPFCHATTCLDAAHIIPRSQCRPLRLDTDNGVTLCRHHHAWYHAHPGKFGMFCATLGPQYTRLQNKFRAAHPLLTPGSTASA
jgi:hypothetical protein